MVTLKAKYAVISIIVIMLPAINFARLQEKIKCNLKLSGKILNRQKANITIYLEKDGSWTKVLSIKSKTRYVLDLSPKNNYYVLFENNDNKKKFIYIDSGEAGDWCIIMDIDFNNTIDNFAKFFHHPLYKEYVFEIIPKRDEDNIIYSKTFSPTIIK